MSRLFSSILVLWALCAPAHGQSAPAAEPAASPYGHLEYFGFYASAMGHWNFTAELAPFTNLTWIHVGSASQPDDAAREFVERVSEARDAGVRAVLSIEPFLFTGARGYPRSDADIENWLIDLRARLENEGLVDTVAMIYPKDEPFREFRRARDPNFVEQYVTGEVYEDIHADLLTVNAAIKRVFPEKPIGVILSGYEIHHEFFSIPENYDWVGYNCYDNLFRGCEDRSAVQVYGRLLAHMQPHMRLLAVPETWALNERVNQADWAEVLLQRLRHHYEIALSDTRFVAFIPFIWSFDAAGPTPGVGLNRFAGLYDNSPAASGTAFINSVREIGGQIKYARQALPNMAYEDTEAHPSRPASLILGEILGVDDQGTVHARAVDYALPHKNLRVQVVVYGPDGRTLHKSRIARSFVQENSLLNDRPSDGLLLGNHGFTHALPAQLLDAWRGQELHVELLTYADGASLDWAHSAGMRFRVPPPMVIVSPPMRPRLDSGPVAPVRPGHGSGVPGRVGAAMAAKKQILRQDLP